MLHKSLSLFLKLTKIKDLNSRRGLELYEATLCSEMLGEKAGVFCYRRWLALHIWQLAKENLRLEGRISESLMKAMEKGCFIISLHFIFILGFVVSGLALLITNVLIMLNGCWCLWKIRPLFLTLSHHRWATFPSAYSEETLMCDEAVLGKGRVFCLACELPPISIQLCWLVRLEKHRCLLHHTHVIFLQRLT